MKSDVEPADFGAVGDGQADDSAALRRAIEQAGDQAVGLRGRTYAVSDLAIEQSGAKLVGPGRLVAIGDGPAVTVRGQSADEPVREVRLEGVEIIGVAGRSAVRLANACDCVVTDCHVVAREHGARGIHVDHGCSHNTVRQTRVEALAEVEPNSLVCVLVSGRGPACGRAGFFTPPHGTVTGGDATVDHTVIEGCHITGGTHGILLAYAQHTLITGNTISDNLHRNINISPAGCHTRVESNTLLAAGSSAVAMAYGSSHNVVVNNRARSTVTQAWADRDAIHAYVSCSHNVIEGNDIEGDYRYGVYLAVNAERNRVAGNRIRLATQPEIDGDFTVGVAIENDWLPRPLPSGADYSRQNYGDPPAGTPEHLKWGRTDTTGNVVTGNTIEAATCGLYVAQLGEACRTRDNDIRNNTFGPDVERERHDHG